MLLDDSLSFCGYSLADSQSSLIWHLQKCVTNVPCAPVTLRIIEPDALHIQTTFYDVTTEVLYLRRKSYNTELVL